MIKIFHEMPLKLLLDGTEERMTDGSYALVHLFETEPSYYKYMVTQLKKGREVILDNSVFELEKAFDADRFAYWIQKLVDDAQSADSLVYVIPDVLDDSGETLKSFNSFIDKYPNLPGKRMAVAQGEDYQQLVLCYLLLNSSGLLDRTGISFNCKPYSATNNLVEWMEGRQRLIGFLERKVALNSKLHLLGCSLPQEFLKYKGRDDIIASVDTSNPVIHGLYKIPYNESKGLDKKLSIKLIDLFHRNPDEEELSVIENNIHIFRSYLN